jgi:hypothetical protein
MRTDRRTDGQTDRKTRLGKIVAFRNFENAPKNVRMVITLNAGFGIFLHR